MNDTGKRYPVGIVQNQRDVVLSGEFQQSKDLVVGEGEEAVSGSLVSVHYVGVRYSDGVQFDASWDRSTPFEFLLGGGQVIRGWDEGVAGMRVGGRRELWIPADFAYGDRSPSEAIPAGSALIFVVDLLDIVPPFPDPQVNADGSVTLANQGGEFEGNLPWNSEGAGPGLFAGDEIAEGFLDTEGVQIFLTFNIEAVGIPHFDGSGHVACGKTFSYYKIY